MSIKECGCRCCQQRKMPWNFGLAAASLSEMVPTPIDPMNIKDRMKEPAVKMKKVELETVWKNWFAEEDPKRLVLKLDESQYRQLIKADQDCVVKVSFEVPVEEPKREISPTKIQELKAQFLLLRPMHLPESSQVNRYLTFDEYLMRDLFPDWKPE